MTRIFVSSTCYDLGALREDVRGHLLALGHTPIMSEFGSFPINPSATAIGNCKANVRDETDIFVLIVGGNRGSLDPDTGKTVVNLEYETAHAAGIPIFVFIKRTVTALLPIWKKAPEVDYTPHVNAPEVFQFVETIKERGHWIFEFERTSEIKEALSTQLSLMFQNLLSRSRLGILEALPEFAAYGKAAERIAREKTKFWEYLLTAELLKTTLGKLRREYERFKGGLTHQPGVTMRGSAFFDGIRNVFGDFIEISNALAKQMKAVQTAWGPPGVAGDAHEIRCAVDDFTSLAARIIEREQAVSAMRPPEIMLPVRGSLKGIAEGCLLEIERLPVELLRPFENGAEPKGEISIMLEIDSPDFTDFHHEMEKLEQWVNDHPVEAQEIM